VVIVIIVVDPGSDEGAGVVWEMLLEVAEEEGSTKT
jgi:hypothetical protein